MRKHRLWLAAVFMSMPVLAQLPLDPITESETAAARQIAEADPRVREALGGSFSLKYVHSTGYKRTPADDEPRGRYAEILYARRDNRDGVEVLVDLVARSVVDVARMPNWAVPLADDDIAEALEIFRASVQGRALLAGRTEAFHLLEGPIDHQTANSDFVVGLQTIGSNVNPQCATHRCVVLQFYSGGRHQFIDREILVDLTTRDVAVTTHSVTGGGHP